MLRNKLLCCDGQQLKEELMSFLLCPVLNILIDYQEISILTCNAWDVPRSDATSSRNSR